MNSLANKAAFNVAIVFTILLSVLAGLFFTLSSKQFFSYFDVTRQIESLNQTLNSRAITIQTELAETLSQRISVIQQKTSKSELVLILDKETVNNLKQDVFNYLQKQESDWPFVLLFADKNKVVLAANPDDLIGMVYQTRDGRIKLSSAKNEFVLPLDNLAPITIQGGYSVVVTPFSGKDSIDTYHFSIRSIVVLFFCGFLIVGLVLIWLIIQRSLAPIKQLNIATSSIIQGTHPEPIAVSGTDEIAQLTQNFNEAIASLKKQEALRKQNLTDVSHELRTPLTIIIGKLDAWRDGLLKDEHQVQASIMQEANQLSLLVNDLQDLALAQVGELRIHKEQFNLLNTLNEITQASQYAFDDKKVSFKIIVDSQLSLYADKVRFTQIINNLCINAIKHNHEQIDITLKAQLDNSYIKILVIDNGVGITNEQVAKVFNRTVQFSEKTSGLGLGLSIVKNLIELHQGKVSVESRQGYTCFSLLFPLAKNLDC